MPASSLSRSAILALALALPAAGCGPQYEIDRPGTWRSTGANDANLRAMVADKRDLASGAASTTNRGNGPARAVTRLYVDRRRPLLNVSLSKIAPASDSSDTGGASPPAGGPTP